MYDTIINFTHVTHRKCPRRLPSTEAADNLPLREDGEALVEPEVLKVDIGDQVARPTVGNLVSNDIGQTLVSGLETKSSSLVIKVINYRVGQVLDAADGRKVSGGFAVHSADNFALGKDCEALVEPKVFKVFVRHQIPRPTVGNLMGDDVG